MRIVLTILILLTSACSNIKKNQEFDSFLEINGNQIHYKTFGKGQEIILVHGGYLDMDM